MEMEWSDNIIVEMEWEDDIMMLALQCRQVAALVVFWPLVRCTIQWRASFIVDRRPWRQRQWTEDGQCVCSGR
jgi:hypothetical protein